MRRITEFFMARFFSVLTGILLTVATMGQTIEPTTASQAAAAGEWGIISLCCAHLREEPRHGAELGTQALMGTPVKILAEQDEWYRVETPDGYRAWVHPLSIAIKDETQIKAWQHAYRYIYTAMQGFMFKSPEAETMPISDLVAGCIVESTGRRINGFLETTTPDGRKGYVKTGEVMELYQWANRQPDMERLEREARMMTGTTYLWGGTSTKGADCSGYTKLLYFSQGLILPRNASLQAEAGESLGILPFADNYRKGDLLFFGNSSGRINHVALYLGNGRYIHSSGCVKVNSILVGDPLYMGRPILAARRIVTTGKTEGITRVAEHPWYFDLSDTAL